MAYKIVFNKSASKELRKLDGGSYAKVRVAIDKLALNPRPRQSKKLIGGTGLWRLKVETFRVIYDIQDNKLIVLIVRVGHRKEVYRK